METTGKACVEFWKWAPQKGLVNSNTATALRVACTQVLGVLDDWESLDVTALDRDDVFVRFVNKRGKDFTPESLQSYKSRFLRGLDTFLEYSKNPAGWKPKGPSPKREKHGNGASAPPTAPPAETPAVPPTTAGRTGLVEYPFPLSEGRFAYLRLPADLTANDVKRLTALLNTLALDAA